MKTRLLIIICIVVALVIVSSTYAILFQNQCESLLGDTHYPRPLTFWNCMEFMNMIQENTQPVMKPIPEPEPEKPSGVFYPRIHISIFPNTESTQYVTPDFVTIGPGSQVTWSNYDDVPVSLNSVDPDNIWATSVMQPDGYDTVTFEETGIYEYKGNAGIHGFIVVMDDDGQLLESKFSEVFNPGSPIVYNEGLEPVLLYDNCKRYVYWLNEHGHKDIHVPEDYPRYPPWGNQIFPLVEFCTSNGNIVNVGDENSIRWKFEMKNEN